MTNDVPDTGLVKAFLPLKGGVVPEPKPSCGNCPCGSRDAHGSGGQLVCTRFPPELVMQLKVNQMTGAPTQVPQVGFKPVNADMVCWEHPAMQVRMEQAILAAHERSRKVEREKRAMAARVAGDVPTMMRRTSATHDYDPVTDRPSMRAGVLNSDVNPLDEAALETERQRVRAESAGSQEVDGRKPGDET